MESEYLIDTNAVIDYLDDKLPVGGANLLDGISDKKISVITRIELLGWTNATDEQTLTLQEFVNGSEVYNLNELIILKTIEIRKAYRTKLPDAIIAATALIHKLTLFTHNTGDFKNIPGLKIIDPFKIKKT